MAKLKTKFYSSGHFMAAEAPLEKSKIVLYGIPFDGTVSFRPGSRFGPEAIRQTSTGVEEYSVYQNKDLRDINFTDLGDLELPIGNTEKSMSIIKEAAIELLGLGKIPIVMGGEHLITWPLVQAAVQKYPDLILLHFDAHADLRENYLGENFSHAAVIRLCTQVLKSKAVYQFGIRSGDKPEFSFAGEHTNLFLYEVLKPLQGILPQLKGKPVYVTIDIDVLDPAFAPGTGTPEAGGCTSKELLEAILSLRDLNIIGWDLVEVAPHYDPSGCTSVLAAKIIREAILVLS